MCGSSLLVGLFGSDDLCVRESTYSDAEELCEELAAAHMIPRMGSPREVANAVLWLASDESSFTTAQSLFVDGGWHGKE